MTEIDPKWKENIRSTVYQVFDDEIEDCRVSTIFCRKSYDIWTEKDWFETMIFGPEEDYERRCYTLEEAEKQHQEAIEFVKVKKGNI